MRSLLTYNILLDMLRAKEQFAFSRWGDGEWACVLGHKGKNCDGHQYHKSLSVALGNILKRRPAYYMGMQPMAMRNMGASIRGWLNCYQAGRAWHDADMLHTASMADRLGDFWKILKDRQVVLVSSFNPDEIGRVPLDVKTVNVPIKDAWLYYDNVLSMLSYTAKNCVSDGAVFLFCSGMMTNVLIDEMYKEYGDRFTLLDCGSLFDPLVGRNTRNYHKKIIERNAKCV